MADAAEPGTSGPTVNSRQPSMELESLRNHGSIVQRPSLRQPKPKKKGRMKPDYGVICARCNRQGHESKDCRAKTKVSPSGPLTDILRKGLPKR